MSDSEIEKVAKLIRNNGKALSKDKSKTIIFLKKIGVLSKNGNLSRAYKKICIPIGQD